MRDLWRNLFLIGVFTALLCLTDGAKPNHKIPVNNRKVLVDEVRFGACPDAARNSSAKNDKTYIVNRHTQHFFSEPSLFQTPDFKKDKEKHKIHSSGRMGKNPRKRFAVKYECPGADENDSSSTKTPENNEDSEVDGTFAESDGVPNMADTEAGSDKLAKIVGGDSSHGFWPWIASIQYLGLDREWHHYCGGSLIHAHWVVTAAHCVTDIADLYVRVVLGDYQLSKFSHREQVISPGIILMHEFFNKSTFDFDIALIKLQTDAEINKYVSIADLATKEEVDLLDGNDICYIAGWGNVVGSTTELFLSDQLQQSRMWIMPQVMCGFNPTTQACVYSSEASACKGDSGGPLVCSVDGDWVLVGAASFVYSPTCDPMSPNVYTRLSHFVVWIASVIHKYDANLFNN